MLQEIGDMDKSGLERLIKDMLDAGANDIKKHADKLDFTCKQACAAIPLPDAEQDFRYCPCSISLLADRIFSPLAPKHSPWLCL